MEIIKKVEAVGSQSGTPSTTVTIVDSGEELTEEGKWRYSSLVKKDRISSLHLQCDI